MMQLTLSPWRRSISTPRIVDASWRESGMSCGGTGGASTAWAKVCFRHTDGTMVPSLDRMPPS